ncbi:cleavage and polyadenylation specificity factor subunit 6-like [Coregonus clupeaformis]|uniref:cleavage and polyadenylation specificity factor subunit 6-like n=1 Tax=Coregonus clupeaformis TaxID=59861 RepID=UPI001E1C4642|nr:cleavage and polyadenylation specificity factor subunit 6-like [Coregonus clupeaformis]
MPTANNNALAKEEECVAYRGPSVSLKDKPPDVSTESFLASLSTDPNSDVLPNKGDLALCEKDKSKEEMPTLLCPTATSNTSVEEIVTTPKPLLSGILKKSSAYSNMTEEPTAVQSAGSQDHPQPVPVLTTRKYRPMAAQHGYPSHHYRHPPPPDHGPLQAGPYGPIPPQTGGPPVDFQYQPPPPIPPFGNTAPPPFQHPPQLPTNFSYPTGPPPPMMYPPPQMQNHAGITQWAQPGPGPGPTSPNSFPGGLPLAYGGDPQRFASAESSNPNLNLPPSAAAKEDQKGAAERLLYSDPWDRQPGSGHKKEDRDQYRHRNHSESRHGEKSRNHSRERGKKRDRSRSRERDRSKDSSSHHRGSRHHSKDERHGDRRKERHHSDGDHGNHHKHSRRDSDYEKSRRSSKDSH